MGFITRRVRGEEQDVQVGGLLCAALPDGTNHQT
jgi:hypothetical protein